MNPTPDQQPDESPMGAILHFPSQDTGEDEQHTAPVRVDAERLPHDGSELGDAEPGDDTDQQPSPATSVLARVPRFGTELVPRLRAVAAKPSAEQVRRGGRALGRAGWTVAQGHASWSRRATGAATHGHLREQLRTARASGDSDAVAAWSDRLQTAKDQRARRLKELPATIGAGLKAALVAITVLAGLLLLGGVVFWLTPGGWGWLDWWGVLGSVVSTSAFVATVLFYLVLWAGVPAWLVTAYREGKRSGQVPAWLSVTGQATEEVRIDERAIAQALQHLQYAPLARYFKEGGQLSYTAIPSRDGVGVAAQLRLPPGVIGHDVISRKTRLAATLGRSAIEVWPSTGADEGLLDLWVADHGALDQGAGDWPLLASDQAVDVYTGIPVGLTLRGQQILAPIDGTSWLVGGRPGQGKTSFSRLLVMGACLDPRAQVWVYVLADNADYTPLKNRFARFRVGMGNDVAEAALQALYDLRDEMERRGQIMQDKGAESAAEAGLNPIVAAFDEIHRLFQHRELGKEASEIAEDVIKQARKYGIVIVLTTQSPTATSIPKGVTREVICRVAFSIIDQVGNDALLGSGKYRQGVRATELRPGSKHSPGDRGKALTVGVVPDCDWSMMIGHHVGLDGVNAVADQAMHLLNEHGHHVSQADEPADTERDLLADVAAVLHDVDELGAADTVAALRKLAPRHAAYRNLTGTDLRTQLIDRGVSVPAPSNKPIVRAHAVTKARAAEDDQAG